MRQLTADHLRALLADREPPCLTIYQPTHRRHPENQQDPIRFRNLVKELEASLRREHKTRAVGPLIEPFQALAGDAEFWNHATDGLAVFGAADTFQVFQLQRPVPELAVVADSFHIKYLVRILQSADRFQVLGLSRDGAKLYEGNRDALDEVELGEGVPATIREALGGELAEPHKSVTSAGGAGALHHGQGSKKDVVDVDTEKYFRAVDRAVTEHHSRPSGLPLVLAALTQHHDLFRSVSHNPFLIAEGIRQDPWSFPADGLREAAWKLAEPRYLERLAGLADAYSEARSKRLGSEDLSDLAKAAVAGQIGTLLVEAGRRIPGTLDATGRIAFENLAHPEVDDLLDDLAELVMKLGGEVVVVPADRMFAKSGAAGIYRF